VPERERPQKRSQRRGCRHPSQQPTGPSRAQHLRVIDAVTTEHHREQQRQHLASRVHRSGTVARQQHRVINKALNTEPLGERREQHDSRVRDDLLIVKHDLDAIQSDRSDIINPQGDLLTPGPAAHTACKNPAQGVT